MCCVDLGFVNGLELVKAQPTTSKNPKTTPRPQRSSSNSPLRASDSSDPTDRPLAPSSSSSYSPAAMAPQSQSSSLQRLHHVEEVPSQPALPSPLGCWVRFLNLDAATCLFVCLQWIVRVVELAGAVMEELGNSQGPRADSVATYCGEFMLAIKVNLSIPPSPPSDLCAQCPWLERRKEKKRGAFGI